MANNYVVFRPRKGKHVVVEFRIDRSEELDQRLEDAGIEMLAYSTRYGQYRMQIGREDLEQRTALLRELAKAAHGTDRAQ